LKLKRIGYFSFDTLYSFYGNPMRYFSFILLSCLTFIYSSCVKGIEEDTDEQPIPEEPTQLINLLSNGNCEKWVNHLGGKEEYLDGWSMRTHQGSVFAEHKFVYEGTASAKLCSPQKGITAFVSQSVCVTPGHRIRIVHHYLMKKESGNGARMYCYFRQGGASTNISNSVLETFYDENTLGIIRGGGYGISGFSDTAGEWESFDYTIRVPAIANYFVFEIHSYAGTTFYVDDCYVMDLDIIQR